MSAAGTEESTSSTGHTPDNVIRLSDRERTSKRRFLKHRASRLDRLGRKAWTVNPAQKAPERCKCNILGCIRHSLAACLKNALVIVHPTLPGMESVGMCYACAKDAVESGLYNWFAKP
jgi:hypothetical protein